MYCQTFRFNKRSIYLKLNRKFSQPFQLQMILQEQQKEYDFLKVIKESRQHYLQNQDISLLVFNQPKEQSCYRYSEQMKLIDNKAQLKQKQVEKFVKLVHGLCHIEYNAFKAYLDTLLRYHTEFTGHQQQAFITDLLQIIEEECTHFYELKGILQQNNIEYGDLGVHSGLLEQTDLTKDRLEERLALLSIFSEGKALDSSIKHLNKFIKDQEVMSVITNIIQEEVGHVSIGVKWFKVMAERKGLSYRHLYVDILEKYGLRVMPPINHVLRNQAGFDDQWLNIITNNN